MMLTTLRIITVLAVVAPLLNFTTAKLPIRLPAYVLPRSPQTCTPLELPELRSIVSDIARNFSPDPLPQHPTTPAMDSCNCSQLIDSSRNVSCISSCCGEGQLIFNADLTSGNSHVAPNKGLSWRSSLIDPSSSSSCDRQGVLAIDFRQACGGNTQTCKLRFDFSFAPGHSGWNFNIGDSSNNGYGGDSGHTSNAAEVHNINQNFFVYSNTLPGYASYSQDGRLNVDNVANVVKGNFTVVIGDEFVMFDNSNGIQRAYQSRYLFTLNGQPTTYGTPDYLISLGMNRVITSNFRSGTGLCRATIRAFEC